MAQTEHSRTAPRRTRHPDSQSDEAPLPHQGERIAAPSTRRTDPNKTSRGESPPAAVLHPAPLYKNGPSTAVSTGPRAGPTHHPRARPIERLTWGVSRIRAGGCRPRPGLGSTIVQGGLTARRLDEGGWIYETCMRRSGVAGLGARGERGYVWGDGGDASSHLIRLPNSDSRVVGFRWHGGAERVGRVR